MFLHAKRFLVWSGIVWILSSTYSLRPRRLNVAAFASGGHYKCSPISPHWIKPLQWCKWDCDKTETKISHDIWCIQDIVKHKLVAKVRSHTCRNSGVDENSNRPRTEEETGRTIRAAHHAIKSWGGLIVSVIWYNLLSCRNDVLCMVSPAKGQEKTKVQTKTRINGGQLY